MTIIIHTSQLTHLFRITSINQTTRFQHVSKQYNKGILQLRSKYKYWIYCLKYNSILALTLWTTIDYYTQSDNRLEYLHPKKGATLWQSHQHIFKPWVFQSKGQQSDIKAHHRKCHCKTRIIWPSGSLHAHIQTKSTHQDETAHKTWVLPNKLWMEKIQ